MAFLEKALKTQKCVVRSEVIKLAPPFLLSPVTFIAIPK